MATYKIGNNTGDDYSGTADAQLYEGHATYNYGALSTFQIAKWDVGAWNTTAIKFTGISSLPASLTFASVVLYLYQVGASANNRTMTFKRCLRDWIEGGQYGANRQDDNPDSCCYNEYGSGNSWTTAGGLSDGNDRSATTSMSASIDNATEYKSFTDSQLCTDTQNFYDGTWSNYGWIGERTGGQNDSTTNQFRSRDGTDGQRPYLSITTSAGGGTPNAVYHYYYMQLGCIFSLLFIFNKIFFLIKNLRRIC